MNGERLLKLATFLREKVPDKCWDFGAIMYRGDKSPNEAFECGGGCGTAGCALGWTPICFPKDLVWAWDDEVVFRGDEDSDESDSFRTAEEFFDLTMEEARHFFAVPAYESRLDTTRFEVADRIEAFVKEHAPATTGEGT